MNNKLYCKLCKQEISDISVANKIPNTNDYVCLDCYIEKGIMSQKILEDIKQEEFKKRYGENATSEKRFFGKKTQQEKG